MGAEADTLSTLARRTFRARRFCRAWHGLVGRGRVSCPRYLLTLVFREYFSVGTGTRFACQAGRAQSSRQPVLPVA